MKRSTGLILSLFLLIVAVLPTVLATSPNYEIKKVEVNDLDITTITNLDVERDEDLEIEVTLFGESAVNDSVTDDVRIEAEIIGYEFGPISDITPLFSVDASNTYKKTLHLHIPDDIDASQHYTLRIRASDPLDEEEQSFTLNIDEQRHALNILDVILSPTTVQAGKPFFGKVRVENLGEKEENDVKVVMSIPQLGISESGFIPELVSQQQELSEDFFQEQSSDQIEFILRIPEDAQSGEYTVQVDVIYNRGNSKVSQTRKILVQALPQAASVETVINPESTSKTTKNGVEVMYRIMIANLGTDKGVYSIQLDGVQWADARVEPGFLTVLPDSTGEFAVFVTPVESAEARTYTFNARVMLGTEVVSDVILQTKVEKAEEKSATPTTFKMILAIIFAILVLALIVLGVIIAIRKTQEAEEETPTAAEGQTYYYSPKR